MRRGDGGSEVDISNNMQLRSRFSRTLVGIQTSQRLAASPDSLRKRGVGWTTGDLYRRQHSTVQCSCPTHRADSAKASHRRSPRVPCPPSLHLLSPR